MQLQMYINATFQVLQWPWSYGFYYLYAFYIVFTPVSAGEKNNILLQVMRRPLM